MGFESSPGSVSGGRSAVEGEAMGRHVAASTRDGIAAELDAWDGAVQMTLGEVIAYGRQGPIGRRARPWTLAERLGLYRDWRNAFDPFDAFGI